MSKITPHPHLTYANPSEIAELWDGVGYELANNLWTAFLAIDPDEISESGVVKVANWWRHLSDNDQRAVNRLAGERETGPVSITETVQGRRQLCRGALEQGQETHTCDTYWQG